MQSSAISVYKDSTGLWSYDSQSQETWTYFMKQTTGKKKQFENEML